MGDWPLHGYCSRIKHYPDGFGSGDIKISVDCTTAHEKGSWIELVASTDFDCFLFVQVYVVFSSLLFFFDIGVGAAESEVVLFPNLMVQDKTFFMVNDEFILPVLIPAGTRISARSQCNVTASRTISLNVGLIEGKNFKTPFSYAHCDAYGADETDTTGVEIDPGASADTKGAWIEITGSTTEDLKGFFFRIGDKVNTALTTCYWNLDVAIGAAESEVIIVENWGQTACGTPDRITPLHSPFFGIPIPAGTRISARAACSTTSAADRLFDFVLYGVR